MIDHAAFVVCARSATRLHFSTPRNIEWSSRSSACTRRSRRGDALPCASALRSRCTSPRRRRASVASNAPPTTASSTAQAAPAARVATQRQVQDKATGGDGGRRECGLRAVDFIIVRLVRWASVDDESANKLKLLGQSRSRGWIEMHLPFFLRFLPT